MRIYIDPEKEKIENSIRWIYEAISAIMVQRFVQRENVNEDFSFRLQLTLICEHRTVFISSSIIDCAGYRI